MASLLEWEMLVMHTSEQVLCDMYMKKRSNDKSVPTVYKERHYMDIVRRTAEMSMQAAVEEVQSVPRYPTMGEVHVGYPDI